MESVVEDSTLGTERRRLLSFLIQSARLAVLLEGDLGRPHNHYRPVIAKRHGEGCAIIIRSVRVEVAVVEIAKPSACLPLHREAVKTQLSVAPYVAAQ